MKILFLFLDGVGLGEDNPGRNPLAKANMPVLESLLDGKQLVAGNAPLETQRASLLALDACLGVPGLPQSATGQAVLLTGINVPAALGYHYGPKPNPEVAEIVKQGTLFSKLKSEGKRTALLNAYPPGYFESIATGRRIFSVIRLAVTRAGIPLRTVEDLSHGQALSADFTGLGWRERLSLMKTPIISPHEAGQRLARLAGDYDFSFFEYWLSDYAGHYQDMNAACQILETFDQVLGGLLDACDDQAGLILITSDHGNMEDLSTRHHTINLVPLLVIGGKSMRQKFSEGQADLTSVARGIIALLSG
jgi:2,3-bisphosphoglycerate-independent phosphoglycerate mutase